MKIIEIVPQLSSGGGERFVVDLSNELAERDHEVILCVLHTLRCEDTGFYLPQVSPKVKTISMNKKSGIDLSLFWRLYSFIKKENPDIIHTHLRGIVYAFFAECFVVHGVHTVHSEASKEASDWMSRIIRRLLFKTKRVQPVTISHESHRSFKEFYGYESPIIYNGRNIQQDLTVSDKVKEECVLYRKNSDTRIIIHLARIDEVKRQLLLANVAKRLYNEGYNFSVLFIGADRNNDYVEKVSAVMPPCCHILGQRSNCLEYLKEAGAFALCSIYEGLPISLIEALGVGAVPICTPVGGIVNLITDGENGILSADLQEESFYMAMKRYLEMSDCDIAIIRNKAQNSYKPFSMTVCADKYEFAYKQIIK